MNTAGLWLTVVASGLYHGLSPGMGWPLAVSAGLMGRGSRPLVAALAPLSAGHFLAMLAMLLPFALLVSLLEWERPIRLTASLAILGFGLVLLARRRHPRFLARIPPQRLALWSFAIAIAHGAGLMLLPSYLGLCRAADAGGTLAAGVDADLRLALLVALVHSATMIAAGGACALLVYRVLGLGFISRAWFNLENLWALSLVAVGAASLAAAA